MCKWLMDTIDSFGTKLQQKHDKIFNTLQNTIILLVVIRRLNSLIRDDNNYFFKCLEEKHYRVLFQGLCTIPDWKNSDENWPDYTSNEKLLLKHDIKEDVVHVLICMHKNCKQLIPEVLFSIPIFHFVKGIWEPFKDATKLLTFDSETKRAFGYFKDATSKW